MDKSKHDPELPRGRCRCDLCRFRNAIAGMALTFRQTTPEALYDGYWMGLEDLSVEAVERAVTRAIRRCKFMPTVVELRQLSGEMTIEARAVKAWDAFNRAVSSHGYYHDVDFDDRVINATVRNLGGWEAVCSIEGAKEWDVWLRKRFIETYQVLADSGISPEAAMPMGGFFNRDNAFRGYLDALKPPALIECGLPPHPPGVVPALPDKRPTQRIGQTPLLEHIGTGPDRRFE